MTNAIKLPAVRPHWLALQTESILEPGLPIIDAHHHLWERPEGRYLFQDLLEDTGSGHNIVATVFVQCYAMHRDGGPEWRKPVGETEFVNGVAAMSASGAYGPLRACAGIVSYADLRQGAAVHRLLEAHIAAGGARFKGIRQMAAWDADPAIHSGAYGTPEGLLADAHFRQGFALLAPLGLSFDAWLLHPQLDELVSLARAFPDTAIVLNHIGAPLGVGQYSGRDETAFAQWHAALRTLATCPNVCVKLGGFGMRYTGWALPEREQPPSSETLAELIRPNVDACITAFGANRCMFESNFPVDKASFSYAVCWNAFKRVASAASLQEKTDLFSGTAARFYRLPDDLRSA